MKKNKDYEAVVAKIKKINRQGGEPRWLIGLSGGVDSVLLFQAMLDAGLRGKMEAAHINHGYRGRESDADQVFVEGLCQQAKVPLHLLKGDMVAHKKRHKISLEMAGRKLRYDYYSEVMEARDLQVLALGHHRDDQVETILMRILRGTGPLGLRGMEEFNGRVARPLLSLSKEEIYSLAQAHTLAYREDASNQVDDVLRNKIRLNLLPTLEEDYHPGIKDNLWRLGILAQRHAEFWKGHSERLEKEFLQKDGEGYRIDRKDFTSLSSLEQSELIRIAYKALAGNLTNLGFHHVDQVLERCQDEDAFSLDLRQDIRVYVNSEKIYIIKGREEVLEDVHLLKEGENKTPWGIFYLEARGPRPGERATNYRQFFDKEKLGELYVRTRRPGDRFYPWGMTGSKKVKDYFVDEKIPPFKRDQIPLVCSGEALVWVVGCRPDRRFLAHESSLDPVMIIFEEEIDER